MSWIAPWPNMSGNHNPVSVHSFLDCLFVYVKYCMCQTLIILYYNVFIFNCLFVIEFVMAEIKLAGIYCT